jgi:hypothetical protein
VNTTPPAAPSDSTSIISTLTSAISSLVSLSADSLAKVVGLWTAARAAVSTVASGVAAAASQTTINTAMAKYADIPLSPATLATAIVRNVLPDSSGGAGKAPSGYPSALYPNGVSGNTATQEAALSGVNGNRFAAMVGATGMAYGVVDAIRLYNRNTNMWALEANPDTGSFPVYVNSSDLGPAWGIQLAELYEVIAHSDIRPEYSPDLLKLAKNTISPADVVEMVVKQIISAEIGQNLYVAGGGFAEQFEALVAGAGDSMGPEKITDLLAHELITEAQATRALGMSRINPDFYYAYIAAGGGPGPVHAKWLGPYEIGEAITTGDITAATGLTWLLEQGYPQDQAAAFTTSKGGTTVVKVKNDTASQVLKLYAAQVYTEAETTTALANLGYSSAAIEVLEQQALATQMLAQHNSAVSRVRAAYLVGEITSAQVGADLGELGVPAAAVSAFLTDWDVEIATPKLHLSAAQVGKLLEQGNIDSGTAQAKWVAMGYSSNDAALLLYIYPPPPSGDTTTTSGPT